MTDPPDASSPPSPPGSPPAAPPARHPSPRFARFLLAVEPSETESKVWGVVHDLVDAGAAGVVCHVVLRSTSSAANELDGDPANDQEQAILQRLRARLSSEFGGEARSIPIRILHGDPGQRICEYAEYARCDLIILGTRRRTSFGRWVRGSVSSFVIGNSRRSILLIGE